MSAGSDGDNAAQYSILRGQRGLSFWRPRWHDHRYPRGAMNNGNAAGFLCLGAAMWLLPTLNPTWFPHVAVDGSSTRALWLQLMGVVEFALGLAYLVRYGCIPAFARWRKSAVRRGAIATGEWQTDALPASIIAIDRDASAASLHPLRLRTQLHQLTGLRGALRTTALASVSGSRDSLLQLVRASFTDLHRLYSTKPDEFDQYALEMFSELLRAGSPATPPVRVSEPA